MTDNDDELCIPRSAMYKLIKEVVPQVRLSGEAKDLIANACNEFIHLLATESNNVCEKQSKKLILPDHVLAALDNLGFSEYKEDCVEVMRQMQQEVDKRKKLRSKLDKPGIPEAELLRQQNQLFAEARQQQQMLENAEEWSKMQMEVQLALQRQVSGMSTSSGACGTGGGLTPLTPQLSHSATGGFSGFFAPQMNNGTNPIIAATGSFSASNSDMSGQQNANINNRSNNDDDDDNYD
jgi:histone H3/H4